MNEKESREEGEKMKERGEDPAIAKDMFRNQPRSDLPSFASVPLHCQPEALHA